MKTIRNAFLALTLAGLLAPAAFASDLHHRINLDLVDAPASDVLSAFGSILDAEVKIDERIDGKISIRLNDVTVRTVMDAACESLRCRWQLDTSDGKRRLSFTPLTDVAHTGPRPSRVAEEPLDLEFPQASGRDVLRALAGLLGAELRLTCESAHEQIQLQVRNLSVHEAIELVCDKIDCVCLVEPDALTVS